MPVDIIRYICTNWRFCQCQQSFLIGCADLLSLLGEIHRILFRLVAVKPVYATSIDISCHFKDL